MWKLSLKSKNLPYITGWVLLHVAILWMLLDQSVTFPQIIEHLAKFPSTGMLLFIATVFTILLNQITPSHLKDSIVYWRIFNVLPGCRAFSDLIVKDARIDPKLIEEKYGKFPTNPAEQNVLWYKIYKAHRNGNTIINSSHQMWLLLRDLTALTFIFMTTFTVFKIYGTVPYIKNSNSILSCLILEYAFFTIAAKNAGNRFVLNVLVEAVPNDLLLKKPT